MLGIIGVGLFFAAVMSIIRWIGLYGFVETDEEIREARRKPEFQLGIVFGIGTLLCITAVTFSV